MLLPSTPGMQDPPCQSRGMVVVSSLALYHNLALPLGTVNAMARSSQERSRSELVSLAGCHDSFPRPNKEKVKKIEKGAKRTTKSDKTTEAGFEPTRDKLSGFQVHPLSHSGILPQKRHDKRRNYALQSVYSAGLRNTMTP